MQLLLALTIVGRTRRLWLAGLTRTILSGRLGGLAGTVLTRRPRLTRLTRAVLARLLRLAGLTRLGRIGAADRALLGDDLAAGSLRGVHLAHNALIACRLLRRDGERHRCRARPCDAWPNGKAARALRQRAEPRALPVADLDPSDVAVGIRIKLDVLCSSCRGAAFGHLDKAAGAANAE